MAVRQIILKDASKGTEFLFPVTPESFSVSFGRNVLKVNVHQMGDVHFWGQKTAATVGLSVMLPSGARSYAFSSDYSTDPYGAIELFKRWQDEGKILRFIVSETPVNLAVLLSEVQYGEKDGTGDVYVELTLSEYRETGAVKVQSTSNPSLYRSSQSGGVQQSVQSYTVVKGDTLWAISRKFYGDPTLCWKLADYNGIQNANLIYPGQIVKLPDKGVL